MVKARKIWSLKEGEHAIIEMPKKEWEAKQYFKIKKLKQTRNGVIIELKKFYSKSPAEDVKRLVFYPKLEDIKLFAISSGSMILDGPSEGLKGSVGTLAYKISEDSARIDYIQSHFKQGKPEELTRKKATEYGGWKVHLIQEFFDILPEKVSLITFDELSNASKEIFCDIAAKKGFEKVRDMPSKRWPDEILDMPNTATSKSSVELRKKAR